MIIDSGVATGSFTISSSLLVSGSTVLRGDTTVTGSVTATTGFTGSLFGSSSYALTASFALNGGGGGGGSFPYTGSAQITGSLGVTGSITANQFIDISALKYKENIQNLESADVVYKLRPVTFDWKETSAHDIGFIAEEVNEIIPVLAEIDQNGEAQGVKYSKLTALLTKALQIHEQKLNIQDQQIEELKQEINNLKK
jgi:hypothetical protein